MTPLSSALSSMVWVTQGKTQHLAQLLQEHEGKAMIRWDSNRQVEWVSIQYVEKTLPSRRTPRRNRCQQLPVVASSVELKEEEEILTTRDHCVRAQGIDNGDDDNVEIVLTILPPTPKRLPTYDSNDLRRCKRRLDVDKSNLYHTECVNGGCEDSSLDTQEDVVLADLMETRDGKINGVATTAASRAGDCGPVIGIPGNDKTENVADECSIPCSENRESPHLSETQLLHVQRESDFLACQPAAAVIENDSGAIAVPEGKSPGERNALSLPSLMFTHKSSAYVQNLAEICYTIMNDRRWRIGTGMKPLFAWEYGDDMKAIVSLCHIYQPQPKSIPSATKSCACLLGCGGTSVDDDVDNFMENEQASVTNQDTDGNDCDSRALNIYCRLFYRKGPWFRIDDIYSKYYAPKWTSKDSIANGQEPDQPKFTRTKLFDEAIFQAALSAMQLMICDIHSLSRQGLLRTFRDEEECGRIAGSVRKDGNGVLLSADERRSVLEKLGGSKKKSSVRGKSKLTNEIWKQMSQQQSISAGFFLSGGEGNSQRLLPARPHVNHELVSKLATSVVMSASCVEYLPAAMLRAKLIEVKKSLSTIINQRCTLALDFSKIDSCYRLREAPLRALRRCCRLFLCATCGPGDMRGDGTNGWKSIRDSLQGQAECSIPMTQVVPPPGDSTWNTTVYPGLLSRFGLVHFGFIDAYEELPVSKVTNETDLAMQQVFSRHSTFQLWELSVEVRANVDYLIELNEFILHDERRKVREAEENDSKNPRELDKITLLLGPSDHVDTISKIHVDFLDLLQKSSRRSLIWRFCVEVTADDDVEGTWERVVQDVEESISSVFHNADDKESIGEKHHFRTDCEKVIVVVAIIVTSIFNFCYPRMSANEKMNKTRRCWLRHMWWEGVLAYVLWDCIPVLEKRGLYRYAARALEVLVFGSYQPCSWREGSEVHGEWGSSLERAPIGDLMISRRARGKAIERLMIDYIHMLRKEIKAENAAILQAEKQCRRVKKVKKVKANSTTQLATVKVNALCIRVLAVATNSAFISFSAMRALARRLKKPLDQLLEVGGGKEAQELGMRLRNANHVSDNASEGYVDWVPPTDQTIAVALGGSQTIAGSRCSYVGFEDAASGMADTTSLNVEQLAIEYYASGRLPLNNDELAGGKWDGWHDEGGRLRTLFRLLCACPLLGMDGGCGSKFANYSHSEQCTVHLGKYQGAPFDLHVGSWNQEENGMTTQCVSGFYTRRSQTIQRFLSKVEQSTPQELSDSVYNAIKARASVGKMTRNVSPVLGRDIQQVRTLSMLAAGFGGKQLAAAFRCMVYDYRHFSGGLPDLLLTRALYSDVNGTKEFVDLGEWVGEAFTEEAISKQSIDNRSTMLIDQDDEFLGCSKVGDSGVSRSNTRWNRQPRQDNKKQPPTIPDVPTKLELTHNGRPVLVQCLFVEVKSQNDRLDGRQEDWLNVLDRFGHARVCKFLGSKKKAKTSGQPKIEES